MNHQQQVIKTYKSISNWHKFRLRLFTEGILTGIFAGLVISLFRYALNEAENLRIYIYQNWLIHNVYYILVWFIFLTLLSFLLFKLTKLEPMAKGSGIPQVKGILLGMMRMHWFRVLWVKLISGILGIGAGLSLGREGPSIQLGAAAAQGVSRLLGRTRMEERYLITSGASAGLAAAFNAPLAGILFALEELHRNFSIMVLLPSMAAAITATVISRTLFGSASIFTIPDLQILPINYYGIVIVVALIAGFVGVLFNKGLLNVHKFYNLPVFKNPLHQITFSLFIAGILGFYIPQILGGGNNLINQLAQTPAPLQLLLIFFIGKILFTFISYGCGVPGGFFLPMLVIGALAGSICAGVLTNFNLIEPIYTTNIIVIAMAALFSASVRSPITGTVLIMEMTSSYQQLLSLAIASMIAFVIAELCHSKPIYEELLNRMLNTQKPTPKTLEQRNILELVICSGSILANKSVKDINWPRDTLLVDIKRGEQQIVPFGDTKLLTGDFLYILTENEHIESLQILAEAKNEK